MSTATEFRLPPPATLTDVLLPPDATPAEIAAADGNVFDAIIRVSRRNGRKGDSFMSPDEQVDAIRARANGADIVIARWFNEVDSVSGGSVDREDLQTAVHRACVLGVTKGLFFAKMDRFSRTVQGGLAVITTLEDAGKELWTAREGVIVGDERATATDKFQRTIWLGLAEWQRDTLTEGWEDVTERRVANGIATHAPFGLTKDVAYGPDGKRVSGTRLLIRHPTEWPWVTPIFECRANGLPGSTSGTGASWGDICDWLDEQPDAVPRGGGHWSISTVRQIVQNRVYLGEVRAGDVVNEHAHEAFIPLDLWERANACNATASQRRDAEEYELRGIVRCAGCGWRMVGRSETRALANGDEVLYRYYRCKRRFAWGKCPAPATVIADDVEAIADRIFRERFLVRDLADRIAEPSASTDELVAATAALAQAEAELRAFLTSPATAEMRLTLGDEWVDEGQRERVARVMQARDRVASARNDVLGVAFPHDLAELWPTLSVDERRGFLSDGLEVVAVAKGRQDVVRRVRVWTRDDPSVPRDLPGPRNRGIGCTPILNVVTDAPDIVGALDALAFDDVPAGARVPAGE